MKVVSVAAVAAVIGFGRTVSGHASGSTQKLGVERWKGTRWLVVDRPTTNRIARPTRSNPLRLSAQWTALPSTPQGTATSPVKSRVLAAATISFQNHSQIPPVFVKGLTGYGTARTPAAAP